VIEVATRLELHDGLLVGHDGSSSATEAVRWAARLAHRLGCPLHVLRTWTISSAPRPSTAEPGYVPPLSDFEGAVLTRLEADVSKMSLSDDLDVQCHVLHGASGRRLVEASAGAEMLVVGSRGAGGFRGLLFGSTADQVVRNARCPVVVIPVCSCAPDTEAIRRRTRFVPLLSRGRARQ
jgi:nucleotide-binding universal stress UspA family protein